MTIARFTVATYNVRARLAPRLVVRDLRRLVRRGVDIIALQEMSSGKRRAAVRAKVLDCRRCRFDAYIPRPAAAAATLILYRTPKFERVRAGRTKVSDATFVGRAGAGPATVAAKYVTHVKLRERRTGRLVHVLNNHTVASVQAPGGYPNRNRPARLALYRQHMRTLQHLVDRLRKPRQSVIITGDLNVNFHRDRVVRANLFPVRRMGWVDVRATYATLGTPARGTHVRRRGQDGRLIDYVYVLRRKVLTPVDQRVLKGFASDHRPLLVDFRLRGPRR